MQGLLNKLRCDNYLSLVAASSIIRPGVDQLGMMRTYIQRFHHPAQIQHLHPVVGEQLAETYDEMELLGFPVTLSYFDLLQTRQFSGRKALVMMAQTG